MEERGRTERTEHGRVPLRVSNERNLVVAGLTTNVIDESGQVVERQLLDVEI